MTDMDIAPTVDLLVSLRAERGDVVRLCGEAVDNSFDASASSVSIVIGLSEIIFQDNGIGITPDRFRALFTLGNHSPMAGSRLGRFGIGIKSQAINVANVFIAESKSVEGCWKAQVDWKALWKSGLWRIPFPVPVLTDAARPTGTTITIRDLRPLQRYTIDRLSDELSQRFYPALAEGKSISLNGIAVPLLPDPEMTDIVERTFVFSNGRTAQLRAGILSKPSNLNRVHVAYGHRVIKPASLLGCGKHLGLSDMFARVQLMGRSWHLSKFKDDLADETEREELEDALAEALSPILSKIGTASMSARVAAIGKLVNDLLPEEIAAARPHHLSERQVKSDKAPKRSPRGWVDSDKSDPSDVPAKVRRKDRDKLLITLEGQHELHGVGWFEEGKPNRVNLSQDNPFVAQILEHRDQKHVAIALVLIAILIFEEGRPGGSGSLSPEFQYLKFGERVAKHLEAGRGELERETA